MYDFWTFPLYYLNQINHLVSAGERFGLFIIVIIIYILKGYPQPSKQEGSTSLDIFAIFKRIEI